ncbi:MAG TPA: hypothetical protein PKK10_10605 [Woeseiaceae bacterium]|nr:hypothetical protein [Woeseiaceae bacterium]
MRNVDDLLTLYFYEDGLSADERDEVGNAIASDTVLAERYARLEERLSALPTDDAAPLPDDMLQRFHETIERAARSEHNTTAKARRVPHFWSFLLGSAATAAIVVAVMAGMMQRDNPVPDTAPLIVDLNPVVEADPTFLRRGLKVYFRDSQNGLSSWSNDDDAARIAVIASLVQQNRLFEKLAAQHEAPDLARVLRAFEPILLKLAADDISAEESASLRDKLSFELNVMLTKLTREASDVARPLEQET